MLSDQLRDAIQKLTKKSRGKPGITRYRVAKDSGVEHTVLSQFLRGTRSVRMETVDLLADYLDLELRPKTTRRK